jgi:hypothetical protein
MWLNLEADPGEHIEDAVREAARIADLLRLTVWFSHNGVHVHVNPGTTDSLDERV